MIKRSLDVVPGCGGSVIGVYRDGAPGLVCASAPWCQRLYDVQVASGAGPSTIAIAEGVPILHLVTTTHAPWQEYAQAWRVTAVLSLPLDLGADVTGALTMYWTGHRPWTISSLDHAVEFSMSVQTILGTMFTVARAGLAVLPPAREHVLRDADT